MLKNAAKIGLFIVAVACPAGFAAAEAKVVAKTVKVPSGQERQIGLLGRVTPACANGKVTIRLEKQAANGTVVARPAKLKRGAVKQCPDLTPDVAVIFYQPKSGFLGQDNAVVEVEADGAVLERHEFSITVE